MKTTELAIVGAGPAGMAAAVAAAQHGVRVTVIDEQSAPGGQFLRQPPAQFKVDHWLDGATYQDARQVLAQTGDAPVHWELQSTVAGLFPGESSDPDARWTLLIDRASPDGSGGMQRLHARSVLIAPGCYDMPAIFSGWTLSGVMSAGGIQAFIKSQQLVPGECFVFAGSHPLQLVVADQVVAAGGKVSAVLFAQGRRRALGLFKHPSVLIRNADKFRQTAAILWRLRAAGVPVLFNQTVLRANGSSALQSVSTVPVKAGGRLDKAAIRDLPCDRLGVCFGFLTSSELARQAGVDCRWQASLGGWIARRGADFQTNLPGIYVAGEMTGVAGSDVALLEGQLAGYHCAADAGKLNPNRLTELIQGPDEALRHRQRFADWLAALAWPGNLLLDQLMGDDTTLCKCEEIVTGSIRARLRDHPEVATASAAKLLTRAGMGLCQGRYCHFALTRVLAGERAIPEQSVGGFTARFPSKPLAIESLLKRDSGAK